jgi:hypothetical protein
MSDESKVKDTIDAVTGLVKAVPIYEDALQPAAKELGQGLLTVAKAINVALEPIRLLVWSYGEVREFVNAKVPGLLKNVPPENIITPAPNVAVPALAALVYTGHDESLSNLFANLLATSMDKTTAQEAHPAFVEIIKQLTPDEAKLVSLFARNIPLPIINLRWEYRNPDSDKSGGMDVLVHYSHLGLIAGCSYPDLTPTYIDNVCRLGLADIPKFFTYTGKGVYDSLETAPEILQKKAEIDANVEIKAVIEKAGLKVTELGKQFVKTCILQKS